ncbi:unnamed protein product, partial [marine sediment metagenome]
VVGSSLNANPPKIALLTLLGSRRSAFKVSFKRDNFIKFN